MATNDFSIIGYSTYGTPIFNHNGSPASKSRLRTLFKKGSLVRNNEMKALITSSLTHEETTNNTLLGRVLFTSGSSGGIIHDVFHSKCPPFVPHLNPNIQILTLDPYSALFIGSGSNSNQELDIPKNSLETYDRQNGAKMWEYSATGSIAAETNHTDFPFGSFKVSTSATTNEGIAISSTGKPFSFDSDKEWWIETRFSIEDHDKTEWSFGLHQSEGNGSYNQSSNNQGWPNQAINSSNNRFVLHKFASVVNTVNISGVGDSSGDSVSFDSTINYPSDASDGEIISIGYHWDGTTLDVYLDQTPTGNTPKPMTLFTRLGPDSVGDVDSFTPNTVTPQPFNFPDADKELRIGLYFHTSNSNVEVMHLEYIRAAVKDNFIRVDNSP